MPHTRDAIAIPMETKETRAPWMTAERKKTLRVSVGTVAGVGLATWISMQVVPWFMDQANKNQAAALDQQKAAAVQAAEDRAFTQSKLTELLERSITVGEKQASATNENSRCLEALQDSHQDLCSQLRANNEKFERFIEIQEQAAK